jgi:hypothetical protein
MLKSRVLNQYQAIWKHDYVATGRMTGVEGTVSYQLPRLISIEWTEEVRGEKYRNIWEGLPCSGSKRRPQGLIETAT